MISDLTPYLSPVEYDKIIWGVGPSLMMPTASDDQLGGGKWGACISAAALSQPHEIIAHCIFIIF